MQAEKDNILYFDRDFFQFINYFNQNYNLENYSDIQDQYFKKFQIQDTYYQDKNQSYKLFNSITQKIDYNEGEILKNTILSFSSYVNDYSWIKSSINQKIFELSSKSILSENEKEELAKYFYLIRLDVHDLKLMTFNLTL